jgi:serine/threonine-protein kinase
MVLVAAGPFVMGCADELDVQCEGDERPRRTVELDAFYIDRTEVTQQAWKECMDRSHCGEPLCTLDLALKAEHPVTCVTWEQADNYCRSNHKRLPTEAEWEKAARGLNGGRYPWGSDETPYCSLANFQSCNLPTKTAAVDLRPEGASVFGALDMAGNVYEWVADWHAGYDPAAIDNPLGPTTGLQRVLRGGDYGSDAWALRSFNRRAQDPTIANDAWGFRCAADAN